MEEVLERPVFTHELDFPDSLKDEYLKNKEKPTFEEVINLIPKDKQIFIGV